ESKLLSTATRKGEGAHERNVSLSEPDGECQTPLARNQSLARDIGLAQYLEAFTLENRTGAISIVDMEGERSSAMRPGEKRVTEMHIHFGHQKRGQQFRKLGCNFLQFDHNHF